MSIFRPEPVLLGYRPRQIVSLGPTYPVKKVSLVANVTDCMGSSVMPREPEWDEVNGARHYNSAAGARAAAVRAGVKAFEIHASLMFPIVFEGASIDEIRIRPMQAADHDCAIEAMPAEFEILGLDVVCLPYPTSETASGVLDWVSFGCSPLVCNMLAEDYEINRWCLIDDWNEAVRAACRFAADEPEPGPYGIVQICRINNDHVPMQ